MPAAIASCQNTETNGHSLHKQTPSSFSFYNPLMFTANKPVSRQYLYWVDGVDTEIGFTSDVILYVI